MKGPLIPSLHSLHNNEMAVSADLVFFLFTLVDTSGLLFLSIYAVSRRPDRHPVHHLTMSLAADHSVGLGLRSPERQSVCI